MRWRSASARICLRLLRALGAELRGLALALGLHALVDRLAVLLGQVGAADAHVDHVDAEGLGLAVHLVADLLHDRGALVGDHRLQSTLPMMRRRLPLMSVPSRARATASVPTL